MYFASSGGLDRYIRIWNNVAGQKILVDELKDKLPKATSEALKVCSLQYCHNDLGLCQTSSIRGECSSKLKRQSEFCIMFWHPYYYCVIRVGTA